MSGPAQQALLSIGSDSIIPPFVHSNQIYKQESPITLLCACMTFFFVYVVMEIGNSKVDDFSNLYGITTSVYSESCS